MVKVFLGLGSNLGDRTKNLIRAMELIKENSGIKVVATSSFYRNKAAECVRGGYFLNAVMLLKTSIPPGELLVFLQAVERKLGSPTQKNKQARKIDIDILLYGHRKIQQKKLIIPHPRMWNRDFVLKPLEEISEKFGARFQGERSIILR